MSKQTPGASCANIPSLNAGPRQILIFGREQLLLESRAFVLAKGNFQVSVTMDLREAEKTITERQTDLLMLCHTLPEKDARTIVRRAQTNTPQVPVLLLTAVVPSFSLCVEDFDVLRAQRIALSEG